MKIENSANTQAILLLTASLASREKAPLVTPARYRKLATALFEASLEPADFLGTRSSDAIDVCREILSEGDAEVLLARGLQLGQALEKWNSRAIWVISRADDEYPQILKDRLGLLAPPLLYGCGDLEIVKESGLAVVGSRNIDQELMEETDEVARVAAMAGFSIVSGGARGIDATAMNAVLAAQGKCVGVLANNLFRTVLERHLREPLMESRLLLLSPYDPEVRFQVWNAMDRNKYIYALSSAGLVMNADLEKGGTWSGAVEILDKFHFIPLYVRTSEKPIAALEALKNKGALPWPKDVTEEEFKQRMVADPPSSCASMEQGKLF